MCLLQSLVAAPCAALASALTFPEQKTRDLQDTLQRELDRREEKRQSKELLQLYLQVVEKERSQDMQQGRTLKRWTLLLGINILLEKKMMFYRNPAARRWRYCAVKEKFELFIINFLRVLEGLFCRRWDSAGRSRWHRGGLGCGV